MASILVRGVQNEPFFDFGQAGEIMRAAVGRRESVSLKRSFVEFVRCTRHNVLHLRRFSISFADPHWVVKYDGGQFLMSTYPYLACHDIEGYLKNGEWSIAPGSTVIDAGGCEGEFTLYASKCVGPTGRVLMLEPDAKNVAVARRNFELNDNPANITIVPAGLWHERGTIRFAAGREAQSTMVGEPATDGTSVEVPTLTLADLVRDYGLQRLDLIKMDVEGAELEALSVAKDLPNGFHPRYAIASYHTRDGRSTADRCESVLRDSGYQVSTGNPRHLTTWAT